MIAIVLGCIVVLIAGGVALAALILEITPPRHVESPRWMSESVEGERAFAAALGWTWRTWLSIRGSILVVAVGLAWTMGVAFVDLLAIALAVVGPRLLLAGRAEQRRIGQARAFVTVLRQIASRLTVSNEPFDSILANAARNAPEELAFLRPAAAVADVTPAAVAAVKGARSELLERALVTLLVSRTRDRMILNELLSDHQIPEIEAVIDEAEEVRAVRSSQNTVIAVLAGALLFMFAFLNGVPALHAFYGSATGGLALLVVVAVFLTSVGAMKFLLRQPQAFRWDLDRVVRDAGRIGGA